MSSKKWVWVILGALASYIMVILTTSLLFFLLPGKGSFSGSSILEMVFGGLLVIVITSLCAIIGNSIAKVRGFHISIIVSSLIMIETFWLVFSGQTIDPILFSLATSLFIVIGLVLGNWYHINKILS